MKWYSQFDYITNIVEIMEIQKPFKAQKHSSTIPAVLVQEGKLHVVATAVAVVGA